MTTRREHHRYLWQGTIGTLAECRFVRDHAGMIRRLIRTRRHTLLGDGYV